MRIGELALAADTSSETIRYYERIGLVPRPLRTGSNYRDYGPADVRRLRFIRHARGLGFDLSDIGSFLALADEPDADCSAADAAAGRHSARWRRRSPSFSACGPSSSGWSGSAAAARPPTAGSWRCWPTSPCAGATMAGVEQRMSKRPPFAARSPAL